MMSGKYGLDKHEIETLKEARDILDDIGLDEYADNIEEILEEEGLFEEEKPLEDIARNTLLLLSQ